MVKIGGYGGKMSHYMEVKDSDYNVLREVIELLNNNKKLNLHRTTMLEINDLKKTFENGSPA